MRSTFAVHRIAACLAMQAVAIGAAPTFGQLPFFSGAEGFGGSFAGSAPAGGWFSNATIYHVTNLNDSGPGSFRNAFAQNSSNRIIVFDVAGTIQLNSVLDIRNVSNYYIAGQTAPGPVTVYGNTAQITHSSDRINSNVIVRYLMFRKGTGSGEDAITFAGGSGLADMVATNMILDHVSASWSEDEVLSVANNNTNVTVQYSIISDALVNDHAYGSLIRPRIDSNVTFHHNLYAHNSSRQARFGTYNAETLTADFRNNVIYNWRDRASYAGGSSEAEQEFVDINYVGNYLIAGPGTNSNTTRAFHVDRNVDARVYQSGNAIDSDRQLNPGGVPNGANTGWGMFVVSSPVTDQSLAQMATAFAMAPVTTQSANDAYQQVLDHVGNYWWSRDDIDARVVNNVLTSTGPPIGAAAPITSELNGLLAAPMTTRPTGWDTDNDGMPNEWELAHGLNPASPAGSPDWRLDFDTDGYINLVEYLNEAGEFPAPAPIVFTTATDNRYAEITNWRTDDGGITAGSPWQPSRFDEARINSGTIVVDAPGQHAGVLVVGALAGTPATLDITGGWLRVEDEMIIGVPNAKAFLNLSGGVLSSKELSKSDFGEFNFTGGTLHAETVNFDLTNGGGTLAPGRSIGQTHVLGGLMLNSGTLEIELASDALADNLVVEGGVLLGGDLTVKPLSGFTPMGGDSWQILTAGSITGQFNAITAGYSIIQQGSSLMLFFGDAPPVGMAGDYNGDNEVDAADYVVWRAAITGDVTLANETASPGVVDQADFEAWRANFGATTGETAVGVSQNGMTAVPEPASLALLLIGVIALVASRTTPLV
jgi:hypothetical protein